MENPPSETLLVTEEETEPIQEPLADAPADELESREPEDPAEADAQPEVASEAPEDDSRDDEDAEEGPEAPQGDGAPAEAQDPSGEPTALTDGQESPGEPVAEPEPLKVGPGEKKSDEELRVEATTLLFASSDPLTEHRLTVLLERPQMARVKALLADLQAELDASPMPMVLRKIAGAWRLMTDPSQGEVISRLKKEPKAERISAAALETLAIVAYRQPVTKAEIEAIRGVQAGPVIRALVDRNLVRVTGRADLPGSPLQYGTTKEFLDRFGLAGLKDLPRDGELAEG